MSYLIFIIKLYENGLYYLKIKTDKPSDKPAEKTPAPTTATVRKL